MTDKNGKSLLNLTKTDCKFRIGKLVKHGFIKAVHPVGSLRADSPASVTVVYGKDEQTIVPANKVELL